jgi:hypothetical protein
MRLTDMTPLGDWPECDLQGTELEARAYERNDGSTHILLTEPGQPLPNKDVLSSHNTRLIFRNHGAETKLLGLSVGLDLRGAHAAETLVRYFIDVIGDGPTEFVGTGYIHKPVLALTLGRTGLSPVSEDFLAEVLPQSAYDSSLTPKIHVVRNNLDPDAIVDRSQGGRFYEVVPPDEVERTYPVGAPDHLVALHTPYVL